MIENFQRALDLVDRDLQCSWECQIHHVPHDALQANQDLAIFRATYEALNAQLLDELPQLYVLSLDVMHSCLHRLVAAQRSFHHAGLEQMYQLMGVGCGMALVINMAVMAD